MPPDLLAPEAAVGRRAWRAADLLREGFPRHELPPSLVHALRAAEERAHECGEEGGDARALCPAIGPMLDQAMAALDEGPGFVTLAGLPADDLDNPVSRRLYLAIARALGTPVAQDRRGQMFCDVIDAAPPPAPGEAPVVGSRQADLPFHSDNAFGEIFPDCVGMLCVRPAEVGGLSQLVSAYTILEEVRRVDARLALALERPFPFATTRILRVGEGVHRAVPVVSWRTDGELVFRYLRFQVDEDELPREQIAALDAVDEVLGRPELRVEFATLPGEMCFFSNRWLLHARTKFENVSPLRPRHHVRLWLCRS